MSFEELRAFLLVVDEGSFSSAATQLGISRTTLRRHVDALEAQAGVPLISRNSKGVELTEAGRRLVRGGRAMEHEFGALLHAIRSTDARPSGQLRAHMPAGISPQAMAVVCGLLRANWPDLNLVATFSDEPQTAKLLGVDVVLWFGDTPPPGAWETRTVVATRQRLLASASYLESRGVPRTVADLAHHTMQAWVAPGETTPRLYTSRGAALPLSAVLVTANAHLLHETAQLGLGISWVPDGGIAPSPGREPLVRILDDEIGRDVPLHMGIPSALVDVPKVRIFLQSFDEMRAFVFGQLAPPGPPKTVP